MKILCLGNNTEDTDLQTRALAEQAQMPCHGLLSEFDQPFSALDHSQPGYYHSTVVDIQHGNLKELMTQFDKVIMLDQPIEQWNHPYEFHNTFKLMQSTTTPVEFLNLESIAPAEFFNKLVNTNKSFCIFPFIELHTTYDHVQLCCRSSKPVKKLKDLVDFNLDTDFQHIRQSMLDGKMLPDYCSDCYDRDNKGIVSARVSETPEWAYRLGIKNLKDLKNIKHPAFYDIRPNNKCNLACRSCNADDSHLIAKEFKKLKITPIQKSRIEKHQLDRLDLVKFDNISKLLVSGGEPTIMPEFFKFLEKCIATNHTDFEVNVTTNGTTLSNRLKNLVKQFKNFTWVFSIDGHGDLNHYIRYPSRWNNIVDNWRYHVSQKNTISVNTTISIYNINTLDKLFHWMDVEFPNTLISCTVVGNPSYLDPLLFPDRDSVLRSLDKVIQTDCYKNSAMLKTTINSLYQRFQNRTEVNTLLLNKFFKFNDLLDQNRNTYLKDYVPVLEKCRKNYV